MIFGARNLDTFRFEMDRSIIKIVETFKYLGIFFIENAYFLHSSKTFLRLEKKKLQLLLKRIRSLHVPLVCS